MKALPAVQMAISAKRRMRVHTDGSIPSWPIEQKFGGTIAVASSILIFTGRTVLMP